MFPPTKVGKAEASRISPSSAVVVVLPFDPVMPSIGASSSQLATSISETTGMFRARAA
jgi:hypothetical protein